jgi:glyoxylase-like metal-dependent hydrolase (beta-lactamase superfamily II)
MLKIRAFTFNGFSENTYLISNAERQCWIVDPGMSNESEERQFFDLIEHEKLIPVAIINTHTHLDHIFGVQAVIDRYSIPFGMHKGEEPVLRGAAGSAMLFGFSFSAPPKPTFFIEEGKSLALGDTENIEVLLTPGHSPGSVCFYSANDGWVVGGDVLFAGSIGRTDLPGGHHPTLLESIRTQLLPLPDATIVYPGHGPATTIGEERRSNPWLQ